MHRHTKAGTARSWITVVLILRRAHCLQALRDRHRVAVVTSRRNPIASSGRIPRNLCPFDPRCTHAAAPTRHVRNTCRAPEYRLCPADIPPDIELTPTEQKLLALRLEQSSIPVDQDPYAASVPVVSSGRSMSLPFSNVAPARTSATRCGALTARQRDCAASISL